MVDIGNKPHTARTAAAQGEIKISPACAQLISGNNIKKGDVLSIARIAGIMAVKQTPALIPLCHNILIEKAEINFTQNEQHITAICTVKTTGQTGAEMEALTGVTTALLTIYDMCKSVDKNMEITNIKLIEKSGGKSG